jgi:uncharacterized coiled-coil DUF342 family protein
MGNDIVTRLRKEISKRDREYPVELLPELREAADEIERLRDELVRNADEFRETLTEMRQRIEMLTVERDEARREACVCDARYREERDFPLDIPREEWIQRDAKRIAVGRVWDCFKEEN